MKHRYCVMYVGDDSLNHKMSVWAKDHNEAIKKAKASRRRIDIVTGVRRMSNPFVIWAIALAVILLVLIQIVR